MFTLKEAAGLQRVVANDSLLVVFEGQRGETRSGEGFPEGQNVFSIPVMVHAL